MNGLKIIGLGLGPADLSERARQAILNAPVLAGGRRLLELFPESAARKIPLAGPLADWLAAVEAAADEGGVAVLASGDPNFFGIAARLVERFGPERVEILPNVTSIQSAFARLKKPWQGVDIISLHGRPLENVLAALPGAETLAVFTDPANSPAALARLLIERGQTGWRLTVAENLGAADETIRQMDPAQAAAAQFAPLNIVILERTLAKVPLQIGRADEEYDHQAGLITKAEVRAVALAKLAPEPGMTIWDLGAGCGSVGLEAGQLAPGGRVKAVEKNPERIKDIETNRTRFQAGWLEIIQAELPQGLAQLPDPDRVFIGGGGQALAEIIAASAKRLKDGGLILVSAVRLAALETARTELARAGLAVEVTCVRIDNGRALAGDLYLKPQTPVWLIRGNKSGKAIDA